MATVYDEELSMVKFTLAKAREIRALLAGIDPDTAGAVLADLMAVWVVSHRVKDDHAADPSDVHLAVIQDWLAMLIKLIPPHEAEYLKQLKATHERSN